MSNHKGVQTDHQQGVIGSLVGPDRCQNTSEVLRHGSRLVEPYDGEDAAKLEALRQAAAIGWRDLEAGRYRDVGEDALADYIGQLSARASNSSKLKADHPPSQ
jgi:antitoxin ParD1/3/4